MSVTQDRVVPNCEVAERLLDHPATVGDKEPLVRQVTCKGFRQLAFSPRHQGGWASPLCKVKCVEEKRCPRAKSKNQGLSDSRKSSFTVDCPGGDRCPAFVTKLKESDLSHQSERRVQSC